MELSERDFRVFREVERWRFCLGRHIQFLAGFSSQRTCDRRLRKLLDEGFLERKLILLGTRNAMEVTYQLQQKGLNTAETGFGSAKRVREYHYHPDDIKVLKTGQGILLSKDNHFHSRVIIYKPF